MRVLSSLAIVSIILIIAFAIPCKANSQGIAFVANQPTSKLSLLAGHVAVGIQKDDGSFEFASYGPKILFPVAYSKMEIRNFKTWGQVEAYLSSNDYKNIKIMQVDNPNPDAALDIINKPNVYNFFAFATVVDLPAGENCLTITKKILKAYGVNGLPDLDRTPPFSGPNNYFSYFIPGREYNLNRNLQTYLDSDGNPVGIKISSISSVPSDSPSDLMRISNTDSKAISELISEGTRIIQDRFSPAHQQLVYVVIPILLLAIIVSLILQSWEELAVNGVSGLILLYIANTLLGSGIIITPVTILLCAIGGFPGAILIIVLKQFFGIYL